MSARSPRDPRTGPEQRHMRAPDDPACDDLPDEREEARTREAGNAACNEVPAQEPADRAVARVATSQNGAVTHAQLIQAGLQHSGIGRRSDRGLLHRIHRGIYVPGHEALAQYARETAAILATGEDAVISHSSAANLWDIAAVEDEDIHVTVIGRRRRSRPGLIVHYASTLDSRDTRRLRGLPITAPARTLFDL